MAHSAWTRDQLLKVLALYCQIPFGAMHARKAEVIGVAAEIGRTAGAVALKLVNFASMDPELAARGIKGMGNASEADRKIWAEFYGKWDVLSEQVAIEAAVRDEIGALDVFAGRGVPSPKQIQTEVMKLVAQRRGQAFFRAAVLAANEEKCCITGIASPELLRASHIVPWSKNEALRLEPRNGLCLNALHDAAFDRGLITLSEKCEVRVAKKLKKRMPREVWEGMFEVHEGREVKMPERFRPEREYLTYHRERVFCG